MLDVQPEGAPVPTTITVYPISGRQLFFRVPHSWCEECDVTIRLVERVVDDLDGDFDVRVKSTTSTATSTCA